MEPPPGPTWTAGQVAQQLGISESTLRTWHRRYGLDPQDAEPGHYRHYREEDVARLRRMLELIKGGTLASEAARTVQHGQSASVPPARDVADLVAAAQGLDTELCGFLLDSIFTRRGVVDAWELVCCPALAAVIRRFFASTKTNCAVMNMSTAESSSNINRFTRASSVAG